MQEDIDRLKKLVAEFEQLARSPQPSAYEAALNVLGQIECQARILRPIVAAQHKGETR